MSMDTVDRSKTDVDHLTCSTASSGWSLAAFLLGYFSLVFLIITTPGASNLNAALTIDGILIFATIACFVIGIKNRRKVFVISRNGFYLLTSNTLVYWHDISRVAIARIPGSPFLVIHLKETKPYRKELAHRSLLVSWAFGPAALAVPLRGIRPEPSKVLAAATRLLAVPSSSASQIAETSRSSRLPRLWPAILMLGIPAIAIAAALVEELVTLALEALGKILF